MYQSGYYIWPTNKYANNIQNMVSTQDTMKNNHHLTTECSGLNLIPTLLPGASPAVSQITDEDRRHGLKANKVGVAMDSVNTSHILSHSMLQP